MPAITLPETQNPGEVAASSWANAVRQALSDLDTRTRYVTLEPFGFKDDVNVSVGDGAAYIAIPSELNGTVLVYAHARHKTAGTGTTNKTKIQIHNVNNVVDILSTVLSIDAGETGSETAATAYVINTSNDDVAAYDLLRIDVDQVPETTAPQGLMVTLGFRWA